MLGSHRPPNLRWQLKTLGTLTDYVVRDNSRQSQPRMERFAFVDVVFVAGNVLRPLLNSRLTMGASDDNS